MLRRLSSLWKSSASLVFILLATLLWGVTPFAIQAAASEFSSAALVSIRLLLAGLIMTLLVGPRVLLRAVRSHWKLFFALAAFGFTIPHLFYIYALKTVPIATLTFITNSYPAMAIMLAMLLLRERPTPRHIAGIGCALTGLYLLAGAALRLGPGAAAGLIFALVASLGWASSAIAGKKITAALAPLEISAGRHLLAGLLALPLMLVEGGSLATVSLTGWGMVLLLVAISILSFFFYYRGLAKTSVATASIIESFTPVVTLLISLVFFNEHLDAARWLGAALVMTGTLLVTLQEISWSARPAALPAAVVEEARS